jgi:hypothetical protein
MIITSHMQKIIQIYTCLLKLSRKQESVTDGRTDDRYYYISPYCYHGGIIIWYSNNRVRVMVFNVTFNNISVI